MDARPMAFVEDMLARLEMTNESGQLPLDERTALERVNDSMKSLGAVWIDIQTRQMDATTRDHLLQTITAVTQVVDSVTQLREAHQSRFERDIRARLERLEARPTDEPLMGAF